MALKIEKIREDKKNNKIVLLLKGISDVYANTIRRLIIEEVPTLAVEDLEIKDNNSALYDEMLALRLGLIPIKTDLKSYNLKANCKCGGEGCAQCELKISLKSSKKGYVYAGEAQSSDPNCTFVQEEMLVVKLLSKQKIQVNMTAVLGQGKDHAKWSPGWAFYKHEPVVKLGKVKNPELIAKKSTDGVFVLKDKKLELVEDKVYDSLLLDYYTELDEGVVVDYTDNIIFTLESWGQLKNKEILIKSTEMLLEKIESLEKQISNSPD
ncbi:MAG TPA: DNA-directed RNA polymerase subunit D [Candidatus Nanoarchaeia archaeon]|nr:DNA-directed RNA polymerase subunit D [Candidatus Nanoarchaeia archaeon]